MTTQLIIYCLLIGLLGISAQVLVKIISLQAKAKAGNTHFTPISYFKDDWAIILLSLVFVFACIMTVDEILEWKPEIINYIKMGFFFVGYTGSSLLNVILSKAQRKIMDVIDVKTDIADGKVPDKV